MIFRKAEPEDIDAIEELYAASCVYLEEHINYPKWEKDIYPNRETAETGVMTGTQYVCLSGGRLAGAVRLSHEPEAGYAGAPWKTPDDYSKIFVIYTLAVHPDFYGRGVGRFMLAEAERIARESGGISIRLDAVAGNIPAERLYRGAGYELIAEKSLGYEELGLPLFALYEKVLRRENGPAENEGTGHMETERLLLRPFRETDAAQMHELFSDAEAMRLVGMLPAFESVSRSEERIRRWSGHGSRLAVTLRESGDVIGYIAVNRDSEDGRDDTRELGFALTAEYRGRGYMLEAVNAVVSELKKEGVRHVWACCFEENACSERLIRRAGFTFRQKGSYDAPNDRTYTSLEFCLDL